MDNGSTASPFEALKAQQQAHVEPAPAIKLTNGINGTHHDSGVSMTELAPSPDTATSAPPAGDQVMSLEAEESAGGPPMPLAAAPAVSAVREPNGDVTMHEVDGQERPIDEGADKLGGGAGAAVDHGMPGDARQLGLGPETDERAPPMTADIEQPTGPAERIDGDVEMADSTHHATVTPALSNLLAPAPSPPSTLPDGAPSFSHALTEPEPLPPNLAPATAPGVPSSEIPHSTASNATAPPTPGGAADVVAAHPPAPEGVNLLSPPPLTKRPAEEDDDREAKRQRQEFEPSAAPAPSLAAPALTAAPLEPAVSPVPPPPAPTEQVAAPSEPSAAPIEPTAEYGAPSYSAPASYTPPVASSSQHVAPHALPPEAFSHPAQQYSEPYSAPSTVSPAQLASPFSHSPSGYDAAPSLPPPAPARMPKEHQRFAEGVMRNLKKQREAFAFLNPVDPVALNLPTYTQHITQPMDLGTAEKKLKAHKYHDVHEWVADVRLIWANCYRFNGPPGPNAPVSISAKTLEESFEKQVPKIPTPKPPKPAPLPKKAAPPARPPLVMPKREVSPSVARKERRPSNALPTIRRTSTGDQSGSKREIRAPQPYEPDYDDSPMSARPRGGVRQSQQMRYCREILRELTKKSNEIFTYPFLHPVDHIALGIPDYPRIVKRPMDLSTVRKKYEAGEYYSPEDFAEDVRLICKNCFIYNPPGTPVHELGRKLEVLFESKYAAMPDPNEYEDDSYGDDDDKISQMERQLRMMRENLDMLKSAKRGGGGLGGNLSRKNSKSSAPPRSARPSAEHVRRRSSAGPTDPAYHYGDDYDEEPAHMPPQRAESGPQGVSFEMKRELATKITTFEGEQLEKAIQIIRNSAPELLGDESKEIELDIDQLDGRTLLKLYNYVVLNKDGSSKSGNSMASPTSPKKQRLETLTAAGTKTQKSGRAGTGGLKGQSLDEEAEAARIAALEQKLQAYGAGGETPTATGVATPTSATAMPAAPPSDSSSDDGSSSDED